MWRIQNNTITQHPTTHCSLQLLPYNTSGDIVIVTPPGRTRSTSLSTHYPISNNSYIIPVMASEQTNFGSYQWLSYQVIFANHLRYQELVTCLTKKLDPAFLIYHPADSNSLPFPNIAHWNIGICNITKIVAKASHHGTAQWLARQCKLHGYPPISTQIVQSLDNWLSYQAQPPRQLKAVTCPSLKTWVTTKLEHYKENPIHSRYAGMAQTAGTRPGPSGLHSTKTGKQLEDLISLTKESGVTTTQSLLSWIQNHPMKKPEFMHKLYSPGQFTQLMSKALEWVAREEKSLVWVEEIYTVKKGDHPRGDNWMSLNKSTQCLDEWFKWQNIDTKEFLTSIENIMEKKINKVNTLLLLGPSNGGKTLIARSICDAFQSVGVCLQGINYSFFLESCMNTSHPP